MYNRRNYVGPEVTVSFRRFVGCFSKFCDVRFQMASDIFVKLFLSVQTVMLIASDISESRNLCCDVIKPVFGRSYP
jgi:hypothetical protein